MSALIQSTSRPSNPNRPSNSKNNNQSSTAVADIPDGHVQDDNGIQPVDGSRDMAVKKKKVVSEKNPRRRRSNVYRHRLRSHPCRQLRSRKTSVEQNP